MSAYAAEFKIIIQIKILFAIEKWNSFNMLKQRTSMHISYHNINLWIYENLKLLHD
jgi:hypothetical protein